MRSLDHIIGSMDRRLNKLWDKVKDRGKKKVKDREAWRSVVHGTAKRHD